MTTPFSDRAIAASARHPVATDVVLVVIVASAGLLGSLSAGGDELPRSLVQGGISSVILLVRRSRPALVLAVLTATMMASMLGGTEGSAEFVGYGAALYTMGTCGGDRRLWAKGASVAIVTVGIVLAPDPYVVSEEGLSLVDTLAGALIISGFFGALWMIGEAVRRRRAVEVELRATNQALLDEREKTERRAVLDERVRIARELHDVVAHHVSVMGLQAGAARVALTQHPERAEAALGEIERSSRQTVEELQRLLGFLRQDEADSTAPQPRLADLDTLVDDLGRAGRSVHLVRPTVEELPSSVELTVYRVVQEGLTNAMKHGTSDRVDVTIAIATGHAAPAVTVAIRSSAAHESGPWTTLPKGREGHGIRGMRERASFHGGGVEVRERTGGFAVDIVLPLVVTPQSAEVAG